MDSPYQQFLNTNYAPTVDEARHIESIVGESSKELADLDEQIDNLQQQLDLLHEKRENLRPFSGRHKALLSPMRKLTRDVLEEIFLACLPIDRNPCMSATEAPMLLTRICSTWRTIALSTPMLWAKIHIPLPVIHIAQYGDEKDLVVQEQRLRGILKLREAAVIEWLDRSYACPLSISIYQTRGWSHPELSEKYSISCEKVRNLHVLFMRATIVPHHKHWRDLDLYAADDTLCGFLDIGLKAENLENLESLHITHQMTYTPGRHQTLPYQWKDFVSLMPRRITAATFHGFPIRNSDFPSISHYSWENLTELSLKWEEDPSSSPVHAIKFVASILRRCHSLKTLSLIMWSERDDSFELLQTEDIILQHLTTLTISIPLSRDALVFAKLLYLPSVDNLGFQFAASREPHTIDIVQEMISSILRASENFSVIRMFVPSWASCFDDLVEVLKLTPELRCLKISSQAASTELDRWPSSYFHAPQTYFRKVVNDSLLEALVPTNRQDSDIICPKLEALMFDNQLITGITERCLKNFIMSRENDERVPSLRRISVYIDEPKQQQDSNADKVSLGNDSAVYFKRKQASRYSPFDGVDDECINIIAFGSGALPSDCYNEL